MDRTVITMVFDYYYHTLFADFWQKHYHLRPDFRNIRRKNVIYIPFDVHTNQECFCLLCYCFASKIVQISTFRDKSRKNRRVYRVKERLWPKPTAFPFFPIPKDPKETKEQRSWWFFFFDFFQAQMPNVTKNHVKIDIFKETKHRLDPNQVHWRSFRPPKNQ